MEININTYKTFLTIFNRVKRNAKQKYFETILYENKNNIKETWSILRKIINNQENDRNMPSSFNINGNETSDPLKIFEGFNDFFSKIGQTIQDNVPSPHTNFTHHMKGTFPHNLYMSPIVIVMWVFLTLGSFTYNDDFN